jgi:hypothetical protein
VFPVVPGYFILFGIVLPIISLFVPEFLMTSLSATIPLGYVLYDIIHYFLHHSQPREGYWKGLK